MADRYFLITHRFDEAKQYRAIAPSKNQVKKSLPRFTEWGGYLVYFDVSEISATEYRRRKDLPDVITAIA